MAKPRVFISSTYYDLKYIRSALELFIEELGYEAVLSEKGEIAYAHDVPLDESCYREVQISDILVLVIGGRYGSAASTSKHDSSSSTEKGHQRYESITKMEHKAAVDADIPVYVLVDRAVYSEFQTYNKNKTSRDIVYAHVDSVNVFVFIESILAQSRNNPIQQFDRPSDIEGWLREQWAGLFRELLRKKSSQMQIASLSAQVQALSEVNVTLRRYLEEVMAKVAPQDARKLIKSESLRLDEVERLLKLRENGFVKFMMRNAGVEVSPVEAILRTAKTPEELIASIVALAKDDSDREFLSELGANSEFRDDVNSALDILGLSPLWPMDGPRKRVKGRPSRIKGRA